MPEEKKFNLKKIAKGILLALIINFILIFILALACYFFVVTDRALSMLALGTTGLSVFVSAYLMSRNIHSSGLINGGLLALGYMVVLLVSGAIVDKGFFFDFHTLIITIVALSSGMLGGILGINSKN